MNWSRTSACPPKEMTKWRGHPRIHRYHYSCNTGGNTVDASSSGHWQSDKHRIERRRPFAGKPARCLRPV
eukprot:56041-Pyramimonas_sp.AAC.1